MRIDWEYIALMFVVGAIVIAPSFVGCHNEPPKVKCANGTEVTLESGASDPSAAEVKEICEAGKPS